ncbi:hypothetical protein VNO80_23565 [Phaseolus coccineus]|uniref:Pentatricopeptide repeat-containing protein n=1 Tax=Phaseolus coccineus TaxID=3886 RepID=A0AAN9MBE0_PHACN
MAICFYTTATKLTSCYTPTYFWFGLFALGFLVTSSMRQETGKGCSERYQRELPNAEPLNHVTQVRSNNSSVVYFCFFFFRCLLLMTLLRVAVGEVVRAGTRNWARWVSGGASSPSLSIWRRKKEIGKEGLLVAKELKRLRSDPVRLDRYIRSSVSRLLKSDLVAVLAEFQRQNQVFLCIKLYEIVRKEIWYRPDMFFYRDMLMMLARNKRVEEAKEVWDDLKDEQVLFDQHTFGDIIRAFLDNGLPSEAMEIYEEMRQSPEPPLSLPFRVILKGLIPYPELREKVKHDFLDIFPDMIIYDPPEDLFEDH